jgi:nucleoside-diphosphate-sugar epimerase
MRDVLITGATGFMGRALAADLLAKFPKLSLWALVRASEEFGPEERPELSKLIGHPRFHVIEGDVGSPGLGIARAPRQGRRALPDFDTCFHLAAATDFSEMNRESTFATNVDGTQNLLAFLSGLARRPRLYHVSTAFVQWQGRELVTEELLGDGPYSNAYEASKHLAERIVAASDADWVIVRPSILVGDSRTGESESDKMAYGALRSYWAFREFLRVRHAETGEMKGPFRVLCSSEIRRNFLCVDDATRLTAAIAAAHPPKGTIVHVVNPVTTDMHQCSEAALDCLEIESIALTPTIHGTLSSEERMLARNLRLYGPYMTMQEPVFDLSKLRAIVGDAAVDAIAAPTPRMLRFLFGTHLRHVLEPQGGAFRRALAS